MVLYDVGLSLEILETTWTPGSLSKSLVSQFGVSSHLTDRISDLQGGIHAQQQLGLLGTTENELGLRKWLEGQGHTLVTTSDKDGENSVFEKELVDAEVIITTP